MLDDHGQLMAERRVVGHAVRDGGRQDVAMAGCVRQAFAVQRRAAGGAAQEEAARLHVARSPSQVADALEAEHRVIDIERQHRQAVDRIAGAGRGPGRDRTRLGDAFLQDLAVARFAVVQH
ncbi:hypothetical protein G6F31_021079 [Rhizopus arrhizus]|nr:hypothetical protein G6F31_021079 [Rhizopus arrhizus]